MRVIARKYRYFFVIPLILLVSSYSRAQVLPPFLQYEAGESWADSVLATLTLRQQIAQLFMANAYSNRGPEHSYKLSKLIEKNEIGGLVFFQGGPYRQAILQNHYQELSRIPLLIAMDCEWGVGMRLDSTQDFPYQITLGATRRPELVEQMGQEIGRQFKRLGMHVNFAPVLDVNKTPSNPVISYRAFGEHKELVSQLGWAYAKGMQDAGILATSKHFPGHGDTDTDSHYDLPLIPFSKQRLDSVELYPFAKSFEKGMGATMIAHLNIPAWESEDKLPSTLSQSIVTQVLKDSLSFQGMVFTDAMNMQAITKAYPSGQADLKAFLAGNDMLEYSLDIPQGIAAILEAVQSGMVDSAEVARRCHKVLRLKAWAFHNTPIKVNPQNLYEELHTRESQYVIQQLSEAALTLLRNPQDYLPYKRLDTLDLAVVSIDKSTNEFVATLKKFTKVTSYYLHPEASQEAVEQVKEKLSRHNSWIVGLHQTGRRPNNTQGVSDEVKAFMQEMAPKSVVVVFRNPYTLNYYPGLENSKALVMAYESRPAMEQAAAQLLFGAVGAQGKLPVTVNAHFPYGAGLKSPGGLRLKFTTPEEVGWDGALLEHKLDSIVEAGLEGNAYPGAQLLVAKSGKVVFHKAYGYHTYDSLRKVSLDDLYDFASVTKVTGPLPGLMHLYESGKIDLDQPFSRYWTDWKRGNKKNLVFREILAHQARLKAWIAYWTTSFKRDSTFKRKTFRMRPSEDYPIPITEYLYLHKDYRHKQIYKQIRKSPLNAEPGYVYSGLTFYLYPKMIEDMTGQDYRAFTYGTFYNRLGAYSLRYNPMEEFALEHIIPTERDTFFRMRQIHGKVHDEGAVMMEGVSGNAGLFGRSHDLAKLMQMYMNKGSYGGETFLKPETVEEFIRYQFRDQGNRRGLGFDKPPLTPEGKANGYVAPSASDVSFGHSGYTGTFTWADPEQELLIVLFSNRVYPTRLNTRLYRLNIRPSLHQVLYDMEEMAKLE